MNGKLKLFSCERSQSDRLNKFFFTLSQNPKKVDDFTIDIVISFNWRGCTIDQNGNRAAKRLTVMLCSRQ